MFPTLGLIGSVIIAIAYLPQIFSIIKTKDTSGIDARMWWLWLLATILVMIHAFTGDDLVFKFFTAINFANIVIILTLIYFRRH